MSTLRKRRFDRPTEPDDVSAALDLASIASIDYSSEDPAPSIEHLVDERSGPGGSYWAAAEADTTESLVLIFDQPQSVARLVYEVEEMERERTQEALRVYPLSHQGPLQPPSGSSSSSSSSSFHFMVSGRDMPRPRRKQHARRLCRPSRGVGLMSWRTT